MSSHLPPHLPGDQKRPPSIPQHAPIHAHSIRDTSFDTNVNSSNTSFTSIHNNMPSLQQHNNSSNTISNKENHPPANTQNTQQNKGSRPPSNSRKLRVEIIPYVTKDELNSVPKYVFFNQLSFQFISTLF